MIDRSLTSTFDRQQFSVLADDQRRIAEIGRIVSSALSIDEVFSEFAEQAYGLVSFDRLVISTLSEDGSELIDRFVSGISFEGSGPGVRTPVVYGDIYDRIFVQKRQFAATGRELDDLNQVTPSEGSKIEAGLRSLLVTPLVWQGSVTGCLNFRSLKLNAFGSREIELAGLIANQVAGAIATAGQYEKLERQALEREHLAEIGRIISSSPNLEDVIAAFSEHVRLLVPSDRLRIWNSSGDMSSVTSLTADGPQVEDPPIDPRRPPIPEVVYEQVVRKKLHFVANGKEFERFKEGKPHEEARYSAGLRSVLVIPLLWQGEFVGGLGFRSCDPEAFGEHEIELAWQVSRQIAGAIAAARQYSLIEAESARRQRLAEEQSRIAEIGRIVSSTLDLQSVFSAFVEQAKELVPFDRLVVAAVNDDLTEVTDVFVDGFEVSRESGKGTVPISRDGLLYDGLRNKTELVLNGDDYVSLANSRPREQLRRDMGLNSYLFLPLVWQGRAIGSLNLRSVDPQAYTPAVVDLAKQIAAQIAGAIATSNQYRRLEEESAERRRLADEQSRIAEIGRIVSSTLDLPTALSASAEQARMLVPFDRIAISTINSEMTEVTDIYVDGIEIEGEVTGSSYSAEQDIDQINSFLDRSAFTKNGEQYVEYANSNLVEKARFDAGMRSLLFAPLVWQGRGMGVIKFRSIDPHAYGDHEIDLAKQIAALIAGAIATTDQYSALKKSEENFRDLVEGGRILVWRVDAEGRFSYLNPAWGQLLGYTVEEMTGTPFVEFIKPGNEDEGLKRFGAIAAGKTMAGLETVFLSSDGSEVNLWFNAYPVLDTNGQFVGAKGIAIDVTTERKAQADIRIQAAALEAADDAVIILKLDTTIEYVNEAFEKITGYSREEVIGKKAPAIPSPEASVDFIDGMWKRLREGKTWRATHASLRKDGTEYQVESTAKPVFGEDGSIVRFIGVRRDITARLQGERDREARRELDAKNEQLLKIDHQREEFFSTVSHELRTPLTAVLAFTDILSRNHDGRLSDLDLEHLDVIKRNGRMLNELVEDMLDISRVKTNTLQLEKSEFEIHDLVESVVESLEPTARQRRQVLSIVAHDSPIWIVADPGRIVQVLSNLITNSCKYSPPSTSIAVKISQQGDRLAVDVEDEGFGIAPEDLPDVFSPFFRSDRDEIRVEKGTGLGLAISKSLVELHAGEISVVSKLGEGTRMHVVLPGASNVPMDLGTRSNRAGLSARPVQ